MNGITPAPAAPSFLLAIPDYILADPSAIRPARPGSSRGRTAACKPDSPQALALLAANVIASGGRCEPYVGPGILARLTWGEHPRPAHWRRAVGGRSNTPRILEALGDMVQLAVESRPNGLPSRLDLGNKLTAADVAARREQLDELVTYDTPDDYKKQVDKAKKRLKVGRRKVKSLRAVYAPLLVFGPSRYSGLTTAQVALLFAATGELTRLPKVKADRPDLAEVLEVNGRLPLPAGQWVQFNGNGRGNKRTRGYKLSTWMARAGYPEKATTARLLADLAALPPGLGVEALGWRQGNRTWYTLAELRAMATHKAGRQLLTRMVLKLFAPATYLSTWRAYFATRLGYRRIPGGQEDAAVPTSGGTSRISSAFDLGQYQGREGLTQRQLAGRLGIAPQELNRMLSGRRRWAPKFEDRCNAELLGLTPLGRKSGRDPNKSKAEPRAPVVQAAVSAPKVEAVPPGPEPTWRPDPKSPSTAPLPGSEVGVVTPGVGSPKPAVAGPPPAPAAAASAAIADGAEAFAEAQARARTEAERKDLAQAEAHARMAEAADAAAKRWAAIEMRIKAEGKPEYESRAAARPADPASLSGARPFDASAVPAAWVRTWCGIPFDFGEHLRDEHQTLAGELAGLDSSPQGHDSPAAHRDDPARLVLGTKNTSPLGAYWAATQSADRRVSALAAEYLAAARVQYSQRPADYRAVLPAEVVESLTAPVEPTPAPAAVRSDPMLVTPGMLPVPPDPSAATGGLEAHATDPFAVGLPHRPAPCATESRPSAEPGYDDSYSSDPAQAPAEHLVGSSPGI